MPPSTGAARASTTRRANALEPSQAPAPPAAAPAMSASGLPIPRPRPAIAASATAAPAAPTAVPIANGHCLISTFMFAVVSPEYHKALDGERRLSAWLFPVPGLDVLADVSPRLA